MIPKSLGLQALPLPCRTISRSGQDILTYTSVGGKTLLPLTIAVDLRGTTDEVEISRQAQCRPVWKPRLYASCRRKERSPSAITARKAPKSVCVSNSAIGGKVENASDDGGRSKSMIITRKIGMTTAMPASITTRMSPAGICPETRWKQRPSITP